MIQLSHISKTFRSGRGRVNAVDDVSLAIPGGRLAAVIGISGSGKTTLLNCMGGLETPDRGEVICCHTPLHRLGAGQLSRFQRRHIGFVFQRGNLLSYLTVADNIEVPLRLNGIRGNAARKRIAALLEAIGLTSASKALPHELSAGETQRVSVARAVAHQPKLLLADEPTANLDTANGRRIVRMMREVGRQFGCTIVIASHDRTITEVADVVVTMQDGQVLTVE